MTSWGLVLIRALLDSLAHDVDLSHEHDREEQEEECKGDHLPKGWVTKQEWKVDVPGHYEYR